MSNMTSETRERLQEVVYLLIDEVLNADVLNDEEWHAIYDAYHMLESVIDEA